MTLIANLERLRATLPHNVTLVAVTKHRSPQEIVIALNAGISIIAENTIQEAERKFSHLPSRDAIPHERHFIGHLQTNKVNRAVALFDVIQSVDSLRLAEKINAVAAATQQIMPIFLQINISQNPLKHGFNPKELPAVLAAILALPNVKLRGLMTIPHHHPNPEETRPDFRALKNLADQHGLKELSMGMSEDHRIAIEEGSTMVRIGTALFE